MKAYKPNTPFNVPLTLLVPDYSKNSDNSKYGGAVRSYPEENGVLFFGSFKTFGGTDRTVNGLVEVENTAVIETWFNPLITSDCRVKVMQTGAVYEILGEPENINMQNQYLKFRVIGVKGVA